MEVHINVLSLRKHFMLMADVLFMSKHVYMYDYYEHYFIKDKTLICTSIVFPHCVPDYPINKVLRLHDDMFSNKKVIK